MIEIYVVPDVVDIPQSLMLGLLKMVPRYDGQVGPIQLDPEIWAVYGNVDEHTDGKDGSRLGYITQGLILYNDAFKTVLCTQDRELPLSAGSAYRLDPNILHGVSERLLLPYRGRSPGLMIFLAWDIPIEKEMPPHRFAAQAVTELMGSAESDRISNGFTVSYIFDSVLRSQRK